MEIKNITWEELFKMEQGTILKDWYNEGLRIIILKGPSSLCAYIGLPKTHPLANKSYEDLNVSAHGGLTFGADGESTKHLPKDLYWYGLDYSHSGDYSFYYDDPHMKEFTHLGDHKWLPDEVEKDLCGTIYDFKKLMKLAELIKNN